MNILEKINIVIRNSVDLMGNNEVDCLEMDLMYVDDRNEDILILDKILDNNDLKVFKMVVEFQNLVLFKVYCIF